MPYPRVHVSVTFVDTKAGSKPSVFIEAQPYDLSELMGDIRTNEFEQLKTKLKGVVDNHDHQLFFQKENLHRYRFDESVLQSGAVYGMTARRKVGEGEVRKKITASKLVPIISQVDFKKHVEDIAEVVYQRRGRHNLLQKVDSYKVELCIVLIKEKQIKAVPTRVVVCSSSQGGADTTTTATTTTTTGRKRKIVPSTFVFPASKMRISLFAPIETHHKKDKVTTGVPPGKTHKEVTYDLSPFIICGINDDSSESVGDDDEEVDEVFANTFTLSHFRKELMAVAADQFSEEYAVGRCSLGRKCKLFVQKQYNSSS